MTLLPQPVVAGDALVLRTWPTGETSVIASLLTAEHGYVRVLAKSARRPRSALRPLVQPGRLVSVEFNLAPGRELQYLRTGSVLLDPVTAEGGLDRAAFLLAAVELVDRCRPSDAQERQLFALCHDYVRVLSCAAPGSEASLYYAFELALLELQGVGPALDACIGCGRNVSDERPVCWFDPAGGGVVCSRCGTRSTGGTARTLAPEVLATLRGLAEGSAGKLVAVELARAVARETGILLHRFLAYHLPGYRLPTALDLLRPAPPRCERPGLGSVEEDRRDD